MCPACITTLALVTSGATSAGGLAALVLKKAGGKKSGSKIPAPTQAKENRHGQH